MCIIALSMKSTKVLTLGAVQWASALAGREGVAAHTHALVRGCTL